MASDAVGVLDNAYAHQSNPIYGETMANNENFMLFLAGAARSAMSWAKYLLLLVAGSGPRARKKPPGGLHELDREVHSRPWTVHQHAVRQGGFTAKQGGPGPPSRPCICFNLGLYCQLLP